MRWEPPSERVQTILALPLIIPAMIVFFPFVVLPLLITDKLSTWVRLRNRANPKRTWFAWRPVRFDGFWEDVPSQWLWLETVDARWSDRGDCWEYRPLGFVSKYDREVSQ